MSGPLQHSTIQYACNKTSQASLVIASSYRESASCPPALVPVMPIKESQGSMPGEVRFGSGEQACRHEKDSPTVLLFRVLGVHRVRVSPFRCNESCQKSRTPLLHASESRKPSNALLPVLASRLPYIFKV